MQIRTFSIIGLGSIGRRHVNNALSLGYRVIGYDPSKKSCDDAFESIKQGKDRFSLASDELQAIKEGDAIIIANPHKFHNQSLEYCIDAGRSVLIEKPIATKKNGVQSLLNDASAKNLKIACGFNLRFRPIIEKAQECFDALGKPIWARFICASYLPDWRPQSNYLENYTNDGKEGGIIFDIAHELDLAQYLFGRAKVVSAFADNSGMIGLKAEDRASITLTHENAMLSHIYLDYSTRPKQRGFEVAGENGLLKVDLITHHLLLLDRDGNKKEEIRLQAYNTNEEYVAELKNFISSIEHGHKPRCDGAEGLANLENILQARKLANLFE